MLSQGAQELGPTPEQSWGPLIDDRESRITYSALGKQVPSDVRLTAEFDADAPINATAAHFVGLTF